MIDLDKRAEFLVTVRAVIQARMNDAVANAPADLKMDAAKVWATALAEATVVANRLPDDRSHLRCALEFMEFFDGRADWQHEWIRLPHRLAFEVSLDPGDELIDGVWQPINRSWTGLPSGQSATLKVLDLIRRYGPATTEELRRRFPEISGQRLARALRDREADGWLQREGPKGPDTLWSATELLTGSMPDGSRAWTPPPVKEPYQRPTLEEREAELAKRPETKKILAKLRRVGQATAADLRQVAGIKAQRSGLSQLQRMQRAGWIRAVGAGRARVWELAEQTPEG
ncbi:hypothetical protein [Aureimonas frigidaquae]|uniref:hypothetical protein n=1 Tax=Aureimonas frigidaquae TaxID=424757 RepID=UPI0012ED7B36|nr:hypothetical protein [Aureimonas frigidaquae]